MLSILQIPVAFVVLKTMFSRLCNSRDVFIVPDIPSFRRDPFRTHWGKMGIDATKPLSEEAALDFQRTRIPGSEKINLMDYL